MRNGENDSVRFSIGAIPLMCLVVVAIIWFMAAMISGCHQCKVGAQKCSGNTVMTCSPDGWRTTLKCSDVKPGAWKCKQNGDRCACKKEDGQ